MSSLPRAAQAQSDEADRLQAELAAPETPQDQSQEPEASPATPEPAPEPPVAEEPPASPEPEPAPPEDWEKKYRTLKGMFDKDVPRLNAQVRKLTSDLAAAAKAAELREPATPREAAPKLVTEKDAETFGDDLMDVVKRQAMEVVTAQTADMKAHIERLEAENAALKGQVTGVEERQITDTRQAYLSNLTAAAPDWQDINADQGFLDWCMQPDPLSGIVRQEFLNEAFEIGDVARTVTLLDAWRATQPAAPAAPRPNGRASELERQVAPGTSRSTAPAAQPNTGQQISANDVEVFYREVAQGKWTGRDTERVQREAEIDQAAAEGRLI